MKWLCQIPNHISLLRLIAVIGLPSYLLAGRMEDAFFLGIFIVVSDVLDGFLARLLKCTSPAGALLDSIADGGFVFLSLIFMYATGLISVNFFIAAMIPKTLMLIHFFIAKAVHRTWQMTHFVEERVSGISYFALVLYLLKGFSPLTPFVLLCFSLMYAGSFISFIRRYVRSS